MLWKLFAVVMVLLYVTGLTLHVRDAFDLVGLPIEVIACIGLVAYAFDLPTSHRKLWVAFGWLFSGWSVLVIAVGAVRGFIQGLPLYGIAFTVAFAVAFFYPTWLALNRLGREDRI
jgi:hypothetical protein